MPLTNSSLVFAMLLMNEISLLEQRNDQFEGNSHRAKYSKVHNADADTAFEAGQSKRGTSRLANPARHPSPSMILVSE